MTPRSALLLTITALAASPCPASELSAVLSAATAVKAPAAPSPIPDKEWTVMVYLNAKNDLERFGLADVNEMEQIGSTAEINVVAELGRSADYDQSQGNWSGSKRYLVTVDADTSTIASPVLADLPAADMGDWRHLADFGRWAKSRFPARRYMLIVWNHGSGWEKGLPVPARGISYDYDTGSHISPRELALALEAMGGTDVYASDACRMQAAEVAHELRAHAGLIVGSEENEYSSGYYYPWFLEKLTADPAAGPELAATFAVDAFRDFYAYFNRGATHSAVRGTALDGLAEKTRAWTQAAMARAGLPLMRKAKKEAQTFQDRNTKDLYDLVRIVTEGSSDPELTARGRDLLDFMGLELLAANATVTPEYAKARGLTVYAPLSTYNASYHGGSWAEAAGWPAFAAWYARIRSEEDSWMPDFPELKNQ